MNTSFSSILFLGLATSLTAAPYGTGSATEFVGPIESTSSTVITTPQPTPLQLACKDGVLTPQEINNVPLRSWEVRQILATRRHDVRTTPDTLTDFDRKWGEREFGGFAEDKVEATTISRMNENRARGTLRSRSDYWRSVGSEKLTDLLLVITPGGDIARQAEIVFTGRDPITGKQLSRWAAGGMLTIEVVLYLTLLKGPVVVGRLMMMSDELLPLARERIRHVRKKYGLRRVVRGGEEMWQSKGGLQYPGRKTNVRDLDGNTHWVKDPTDPQGKKLARDASGKKIPVSRELEDRLDHVLFHSSGKSKRTAPHSTFPYKDAAYFDFLDEVHATAQRQGIKPEWNAANKNWNYTVPMDRVVGYQSGGHQKGSNPLVDTVVLVLENDPPKGRVPGTRGRPSRRVVTVKGELSDQAAHRTRPAAQPSMDAELRYAAAEKKRKKAEKKRKKAEEKRLHGQNQAKRPRWKPGSAD